MLGARGATGPHASATASAASPARPHRRGDLGVVESGTSCVAYYRAAPDGARCADRESTRRDAHLHWQDTATQIHANTIFHDRYYRESRPPRGATAGRDITTELGTDRQFLDERRIGGRSIASSACRRSGRSAGSERDCAARSPRGHCSHDRRRDGREEYHSSTSGGFSSLEPRSSPALRSVSLRGEEESEIARVRLRRRPARQQWQVQRNAP